MTSNGSGAINKCHGFEVIDGCLAVGGITLRRLADRVGQTPFFAYDRRLITERVALLRRSLPEAVHLSYAVKANPMPAVVQHLARLVDGFDVASAGELKTVLDTPMAPDHISFAGPGKTRREVAQAIASGINLNVESEAELRTIAAVGGELGLRPRVSIRVNPDFDLRGSGMRMGGGPKQFGIDSEIVPAVMRRISELDVEFWGLHVFTGSQNLSATAITEAQTKTIELALRLAEHAPGEVRLLNLGGGFGIPYFPKDQPLDVGGVGRALGDLLPQVEDRLPVARIVIELGRYIVGEAGLYVCRVLDRKVSRGHVFLVTDGGLHHHLAASGNFGQVVRRNYPVVVANRMHSAERETASVVGCLCTPLDLLADKVELSKADVGDLIAIFQSGAYGFSASPTAFLSQPAPAEVLV